MFTYVLLTLTNRPSKQLFWFGIPDSVGSAGALGEGCPAAPPCCSTPAPSLTCTGSRMRMGSNIAVTVRQHLATLVSESVHPGCSSGCLGRCQRLGSPGADPEMDMGAHGVCWGLPGGLPSVEMPGSKWDWAQGKVCC